MTTRYEPLPMAPAMIDAIKATYNITDNDEACQPAIIRKFFEEVIGPALEKPEEVEKEDRDIEMNGINVSISILRPVGSRDIVLPTILFLHGGGWVVGGYFSHAVLTNKLVNSIPCCVIFVNYSLSPEVKYPVALEECYAALCWAQKHGTSINADSKRLAIAGDSAGGNLTAALTIYAKERGNTDISCQVLHYPVTDIDFNSESYEQHKDDPFLPRISMERMWRAYIEHEEQYKTPSAVPMTASLDLLKNLPPALVITADKDVLRSEGEAYAKKLTEAGVHTISVRYLGVGHGFLSTPPLSNQALAAISQTEDFLKKQWSAGY